VEPASKKATRRGAKEEDKSSKSKKNSEEPAKKSKASKQAKSNEESSRKGSQNDTTMDEIRRLTNKKREYLEEAIFDKNGEYFYEEDP
jgi:hypothetical protein